MAEMRPRDLQDDMLDPEDQAWGSPPHRSYKLSLPRFVRRKQTSQT